MFPDGAHRQDVARSRAVLNATLRNFNLSPWTIRRSCMFWGEGAGIIEISLEKLTGGSVRDKKESK